MEEIDFGVSAFHFLETFHIVSLVGPTRLNSITVRLNLLYKPLVYRLVVLCFISYVQCLFITVTIIGGAVYFKELANFSLLQSIMFPLGVGFILVGIFLLSQRDMSKKIPRIRVKCVPPSFPFSLSPQRCDANCVNGVLLCDAQVLRRTVHGPCEPDGEAERSEDWSTATPLLHMRVSQAAAGETMLMSDSSC